MKRSELSRGDLPRDKVRLRMANSRAGSSNDSDSRRVRKLSEKELVEEELAIMNTMDYLKKRLVAIREERAVIADNVSLSSRSSNAWSDVTYYCPRCKEPMRCDEPYHRTTSNKRYHLDCWNREQDSWETEYKGNKLCHTCGREYKEEDGSTWQRSRAKRNWYCGPCAKEAYCGQGERVSEEDEVYQ